MMKSILLGASALMLIACGAATDEAKSVAKDAMKSADMAMVKFDRARLNSAIAAQDDAFKARLQYRNPVETLEFFGIAPGMKVAEPLPGDNGWYSRILIPYLGPDGELTGMDYPADLWSNFNFMTPEAIEAKKTWATDWTAAWEERLGDAPHAKLSAAAMGTTTPDMAGTYDAILYIRAMHNLSRFADKGDFLNKSLTEAHTLLKSGGTLGIVQHAGPEGHSDEWSNGSKGYLKQSTLIKQVEAAGFKFVADADINANPLDMPTEEDFVWRLPPSMATSRENPELQKKMKALGESNRMTLKFVKK